MDSDRPLESSVFACDQSLGSGHLGGRRLFSRSSPFGFPETQRWYGAKNNIDTES